MPGNNRVLIFAEVYNGVPAKINTELVGSGKKIAKELGGELSAVLIGSGVAAYAQELIYLGANEVYLIDDAIFGRYQHDTYVYALSQLCKEISPDVLLFGQTEMVRDLAPRLAFRLETGIVMDCIELGIDGKSKLLKMTRPVYGGKANAVYVMENTRPQIAVIRSKSQEAATRDLSHQGEVINYPVKVSPKHLKLNVIDVIKEEVEGVKLEDAAVIVSGGRGIGSAEGFEKLKELSKLLGGAVGASRSAVDNGWVPSTLQVGQTGKIVSPDLYLAVGISGAMQHLGGCANAKYIVVINRDPDAQFFKMAHFGVVGDWKKVLPAFTERCKTLIND